MEVLFYIFLNNSLVKITNIDIETILIKIIINKVMSKCIPPPRPITPRTPSKEPRLIKIINTDNIFIYSLQYTFNDINNIPITKQFTKLIKNGGFHIYRIRLCGT